MKVFYVTTPIYYANSLPHLGHLYTTVVADVITKHKRQRGFDTFFLTGTDEHGINIQRTAERLGKTPKEQVDFIAEALQKTFADFGINQGPNGYSIFMRTTYPFHYEGARYFWQQIAKNRTPKGNSNIYKGYYEGWFCAPCAAFKTEDEYKLNAQSSVPLCLIHEKPLERVSEESYFFRLSDYAETLLKIIKENPDKIRPEARRNEVIAFIERGLQDLSISRERKNVNWGIPVPGDDNHVMYVWLDALSNYITALGYGNNERSGFDKYWTHAHHLVGKDILRFHTVYWWAFLLAAGLQLPKLVFAHGMWLDAQGRKMGKTLGNVIDLNLLKKYFQTDAVRYFLLREMIFGQDGNFGYENLIDRINADLANGLGNLVARTLTMIDRYRQGVIPNGKISEKNYIFARRASVPPDEQEIVTILEYARNEFIRRFDNFEFSQALETAWGIIARIDKMITDSKPWELAKNPQQAETLNAILYRAVETIRWLSVLLYPILPEATCKIHRQIGFDIEPSKVNPEELRWGETPEGMRIQKVEPIFPRVDKSKIMSDIENSKIQVANPEIAEKQETEKESQRKTDEAVEEYISIDDFLKVDLRVGEIKVAERVPNADKLLRFEVDIGEERPRQILAGLAQYYEPEKLIGRKVVVVANLKPRKMRGLESQGMICAASLDENDIPAIATFIEEVKNGARLK